MSCKVKNIATGKVFDKDEVEAHIDEFIKKSRQLTSAKNIPESGAAKTSSSFLESRHADTVDDEQGKVSGPNDNPISKEGRKDANDLAEEVKDKGVTKVITSDLERANQTGEIVADKTGAEIEHRPELNTWDIGDFDKASDEEFKKAQKYFVDNPNAKEFEGKKINESFNEYKDRVIKARTELQNEPASTLVVNHSNNMMLWDAYKKNGDQWNEQAAKDYLNAKTPEPATLVNKQPLVPKLGDMITSPHFEGERRVRGISKDGNSVFVEGERDHHVHEIPINDITSKNKQNASPIRSDQGQIQTGGNASEGSENTRSQDLQQPPQQTSINGETQQQAGGGPPGQAVENPDELPFGNLPVGISHEAQQDRAAAELDVTPPERGEGITMQEAVQKGRDLIKNGADPEKVLTDFKNTGKISAEDMSVARARYEQLAKATNDAYDKFGKNSPEAKAAFEKERNWYNEAVKPMQTEWHRIGMTQQGRTDIDTGSVMGMQRAFKERTGKDFTPEQEKKAGALAEIVKKLQGQVKDLQDKLTKALDKNAEPTEKGQGKYTKQAKTLADTFRKLKTKEFTFKDSNGNEVPIQKMGISWNDLVELGAKAIEKTGQIADGISAILDKAEQTTWYKDLSDVDKDRFEKELTDHYTSIADKKTAARIKALEKQLADLEAGNVKPKGAPRTPTAREKELNDQIFEAKQKLGLIAPKALPKAIKTPIKPMDIATRFVNKTDNNFTPEEAKAVWGYMKEKYLDEDAAMTDALKGTATDLGISAKQVLAAIASPKDARNITLEMFKKQYERNKAIQFAKRFVETADQSAAKKFWNSLPSRFFNLKTYGHGTVGNITHAGPNLFRPSVWKAYWPNVMKSFALAYGNTGKYEMAITNLKLSPHFDEWIKAGLAADPEKAYDEYKVFGKKQSWLAGAGTRGFAGLNFMRYDMAEMFFDRASDSERADPDLREEIAKLVNHATGHSEVQLTGAVGQAIKVATFAPGLEISRWQRMITDPYKAAATYKNWSKSSPAEQAAAKIVVRGSGERLATYTALLAANAGLLGASGSSQQINLSDPTKSDWLKFKGGDKTLDFTGGVLDPMRLLWSLGMEAYLSRYGDKKDLRTKPGDKDASTITSQLRYKLSPVAGEVADFGTGTDAMGNVLPWSNVTPEKGRYKMDWIDYASQQLPIPIAAGFKAAFDGMRERGMSDASINDIMNGIMQAGIEGFTGVRMNDDYSLDQKGGTGGGSGAGDQYAPTVKEWK